MVATRRDPTEREPILTLGRYALHGEIASGGMATVHFGRMSSLGGFSRTVAIKRMRHDIATDPEFVAMFLDEARLTSRVEHPNVVATLDVVAEGGEVFLVMEYVRGESLSRLIRACRHAKERVPLPIAVSIICGGLTGLHAAHDALGEGGAPLGIIHRDVSPQNILVGEDGVTRITDFGIAKAESRAQVTRDGMMKGKLCYMAPEQLSRAGRLLDRRVDIFACAVVAWELISGKKLFQADHPGETMANVLNAPVPPLTGIREDVTVAVDRAIRKALARNPDQRWKTAEEFALGLEEAMPNIGSNRVVGAWVCKIAGDVLAGRTKYVREIESMGGASGTPISQVKLAPPEDSAPLQDHPPATASDNPSGPPPASFERVSLNATVQEPIPHSPPHHRLAGAIAPPRMPRAGGARTHSPLIAPPASHQEIPSVPSIDSAPIPGPAPSPIGSPIAPSAGPALEQAPGYGFVAVGQTPPAQAAATPWPVQKDSSSSNPLSPPFAAAAVRASSPAITVSAAQPDVINSQATSLPVQTGRSDVERTLDQPISAEALNPYVAPGQIETAAAFVPAANTAQLAAPQDQGSAIWQPPDWSSAEVPVQPQPAPVFPMPNAEVQDHEFGERVEPKIASRLFSTPGRTAAVYLAALALLGLSIGLFIYASGSDASKPSPSDHPAGSQTAATTPTATSLATGSGTTATSLTASSGEPAEVPSPTASVSPTAKGADKSKPNLVPIPPTTRPPGKGAQTYIPDRP